MINPRENDKGVQNHTKYNKLYTQKRQLNKIILSRLATSSLTKRTALSSQGKTENSIAKVNETN